MCLTTHKLGSQLLCVMWAASESKRQAALTNNDQTLRTSLQKNCCLEQIAPICSVCSTCLSFCYYVILSATTTTTTTSDNDSGQSCVCVCVRTHNQTLRHTTNKHMFTDNQIIVIILHKLCCCDHDSLFNSVVTTIRRLEWPHESHIITLLCSCVPYDDETYDRRATTIDDAHSNVA